MKQNLAKDLFFLFAVLLILLCGYAIFRMHGKLTRVTDSATIAESQRLDSSLERIVTQLEAGLVERYALDYTGKTNPLQMNRVITFVPPAIAKLREEEEKARERKKREEANAVQGFSLSATVVSGDVRTAVISYKGKNHIVREGDNLDGRKVLRIEQERTILQLPNGQELVLLSKRAAQQP